MSKPTVLIVEDDFALVRGLTDSFHSNGYHVQVAMDGQTAIDIATSEPIDLVILDIMLPKLNGYQVCQEIRDNQRDMPIIMLTSKGQEADVVRGLNQGADDYVTKPFSILELLARAKAFLRKRSTVEQFNFGDYSLNFNSRTLSKNLIDIALTPKEYGLLCLFIRRQGQVLTRETILHQVWNSNVLTTRRSVDRCVSTLRKKIETQPNNPTFIKSVRDIGYRFDG
ncbi:MAG: response regulator transcription factor [Cellvibrionaceae bacterium]|nr:response regulator transcription factor [Cellvibrionaceae bacterium]